MKRLTRLLVEPSIAVAVVPGWRTFSTLLASCLPDAVRDRLLDEASPSLKESLGLTGVQANSFRIDETAGSRVPLLTSYCRSKPGARCPLRQQNHTIHPQLKNGGNEIQSGLVSSWPLEPYTRYEKTERKKNGQVRFSFNNSCWKKKPVNVQLSATYPAPRPTGRTS